MCLQDLRLGRGVNPKTSVVNLPDATPVKIANGDAARVSLNVAIQTDLSTGTQKPVNICVKVNGTLVPVLSLTSILMHGLLEVSRHGISVTYEIWAVNRAVIVVDLGVIDNSLVLSAEQTVEG